MEESIRQQEFLIAVTEEEHGETPFFFFNLAIEKPTVAQYQLKRSEKEKHTHTQNQVDVRFA